MHHYVFLAIAGCSLVTAAPTLNKMGSGQLNGGEPGTGGAAGVILARDAVRLTGGPEAARGLGSRQWEGIISGGGIRGEENENEEELDRRQWEDLISGGIWGEDDEDEDEELGFCKKGCIITREGTKGEENKDEELDRRQWEGIISGGGIRGEEHESEVEGDDPL